MNINYLVWGWKYDEDACVLSAVNGFPESDLLARGVPLEKRFPTGVTVHMDPEHPEAIELRDFIPLDDNPVCSKRMADFLRAQNLSRLELLPVAVVNHKGKIASDEYFILNPTCAQKCIDPVASKARRSSVDPTMYLTIRQLVMDPEKLTPPDSSIKILRPDEYFAPVLVERGLAKQLADEGFTGSMFTPIDEYEP